MFDPNEFKPKVKAAFFCHMECNELPVEMDYERLYWTSIDVIASICEAHLPPQPLDDATALAIMTAFPATMDQDLNVTGIRSQICDALRFLTTDELMVELAPMLKDLVEMKQAELLAPPAPRR